MRKYVLAFLIASLFCIIGIATLHDYGITWDAPLHMMRGQSFAHFFTSGKPTDHNVKRLSPILINPGEYASRFFFNAIETDKEGARPVKLPVRPAPQRDFQEKKDSPTMSFYDYPTWGWDYAIDHYGHPPFVNIVSGLSNMFFFQKLHIMNDIDSYQLIYVVFSAIGVAVVVLFTYEITNSFLAALFAGIALGFFPIFFAESHFNMKDPIQASFFAGAIWSFWHFVKENKLKWFFVFIIFTCFALGTKWNIVVFPAIIGLWFLTIRKSSEFKTWVRFKKITLYIFSAVILCGLFVISIWPGLWTHPWDIVKIFSFYSQTGTGIDRLQPAGFVLPLGFNIYPLILLLFETPTLLLFFCLIGILAIFIKKDTLKSGFLILFWLLIPIIRVVIPMSWFYSGIRFFMEVLPPMVILSAYGFYYSLSFFRKYFTPVAYKIIQVVFTLLIAGALVWPLIKLHPNENTYFNLLSGGLQGAYKKNILDWTLTGGNVYKQTADWLNAHAEKNANIAFLNGTMEGLSPLWLRSDISISPYHFSGFDAKGEYIVLLDNMLDPTVFALRYPQRFLKPVYQVKVDRVPIASIYKNDKQFYITSTPLNETRSFLFSKNIGHGEKGDYWIFNLNEERRISRLEFKDTSTCLQHKPSLIKFGQDGSPIDPSELGRKGGKVYQLHEIKLNKRDLFEVLLPGETTRYIIIEPKDQGSCFATGELVSYTYISE